MTWADFYLICFAVGFTFSLLSFPLGGLRWHYPSIFICRTSAARMCTPDLTCLRVTAPPRLAMAAEEGTPPSFRR